jgi:hypothetical protein
MAGHVPAGLSGSDRAFGLKVGAGFLVIAGISWWRGYDWAPAVLASLGGALVVGGLVAPRLLHPVHVAWFGLARVLSRFTTPIFMGIIYFGVLTPTAFLSRLFGRRPLRQRAGAGGYWVLRPVESQRRRDLHNQF